MWEVAPMKREKWSTCLIAALLAFLMAAGAVGSVVTGFQLEVTSLGRLILFCGAAAVFSALCFGVKHGDLVLVGAAALAAGYLWRNGEIWEQISTLMRAVSRRYHNAYGWNIISISGCEAGLLVDIPMGIIGCLTALSVSWTICRRRPLIAALPACVIPLIACVIVTDTVPQEIYLYLWMLGLVLLLLTDRTRRKGTRFSTLAMYAALPAAAALAVLFLLVPRESYVNQTGEWGARLEAWGQQLQLFAADSAQNWDIGLTGADSNESVNLRGIGPQSQWGYKVMEVTSPVSGTIYLRGQDYDTYSGTGWTSSQRRREAFSAGNQVLGELTIETRRARDVQYLPYYTGEAMTLVGGRVENEQKLTHYSFQLAAQAVRSELTDLDAAVIVAGVGQPETEEEQNIRLRYKNLPNDTKAWASQLASQIIAGKSTTESQAEAIAAYVRHSASYSLRTSRMPSDAEDFACWFLEESDTGYCVHFATAAAVLLRAAGIPARYVTGYMVSCQAGETTAVTDENAHAWVEYYNSDGVWTVLEATPAAEETAETAAGTLPREETAAQPTAAGTRPTESQTKPSAPAGTGQDRQAGGARQVPAWLKAALGILLAVCGAVAQSALRAARKEKLWNRGSPNRQALARWGQAEKLARLAGVELPEALEELALKAQFSQHTLTEEELAVFDSFRRDARHSLRQRPWYKRLIWYLIFAVS